MRPFFTCIYFSFIPSLAFSAGPLLHLWVADKFCQAYGICDEALIKEILVGTEFPDIRYITHESRGHTHPIVASLDDVCRSSSGFACGMKLHAWLDVVREKFICTDVYGAIADQSAGHPHTLLKWIEEEILADYYDAGRWLSCFNEVLPEELAFTQEASIAKWHWMIQCSLSIRPSWLIWAHSYIGSAFGIDASTLYEWSYELPHWKQNRLFREHLIDLTHWIEKQFEKHLISFQKAENFLRSEVQDTVR
jgi:hypothetical protein